MLASVGGRPRRLCVLLTSKELGTSQLDRGADGICSRRRRGERSRARRGGRLALSLLALLLAVVFFRLTILESLGT